MSIASRGTSFYSTYFEVNIRRQLKASSVTLRNVIKSRGLDRRYGLVMILAIVELFYHLEHLLDPHLGPCLAAAQVRTHGSLVCSMFGVTTGATPCLISKEIVLYISIIILLLVGNPHPHVPEDGDTQLFFSSNFY